MTVKTLTYTNKTAFLRFFLLVFFSLVCCYFASGIAIFDAQPNRGLSLNEFIIFAAILAVTGFAYFFIEYKRKGIIHNYYLLGGLGVLFIVNTITTLVFKSPHNFSLVTPLGDTVEGVFEIDITQKIIYLARFFAVLLMSYLTIVVYPQKIKTDKGIKLIAWMMILLAFILIFISYFTNFKDYISFFNKFAESINDDSFAISPLGLHKNTYGYLLVLAIFCALLLHVKEQKWYPYLFVGIIYLHLIFSFCKAGILIATVGVLAYLTARFFLSLKEHKKMNLITLGCFAGLFVLVFALYLIGNQMAETTILNKLSTGINNILFKRNSTITTRSYIWNNAINIAKSTSLVFGCGFGLFGDLLFAYNTASDTTRWINSTHQAHNAWLQYLGNGGIITLVIAAAIIGIFVYACIKIMKNHKSLAIWALILLTCSIGYSLVENYPLFLGTSSEMMCFNALLFIPVMQVYLRENKFIQINDEKEMMPSEPINRNCVFTFISPFVGALTAFGIAAAIKLNLLFLLFLLAPCVYLALILTIKKGDWKITLKQGLLLLITLVVAFVTCYFTFDALIMAIVVIIVVALNATVYAAFLPSLSQYYNSNELMNKINALV